MTGALLNVDSLSARLGDIWVSATGETLTDPASGSVPDGDVVSATVSITGGARLDVVVSADRAVAERLAYVMFGLDDLDPDLVLDAVGEVANQAAGVAKSLVPGEAELALPVAAWAGACLPGRPDVALSWAADGGRVGLQVWLREDEEGSL